MCLLIIAVGVCVSPIVGSHVAEIPRSVRDTVWVCGVPVSCASLQRDTPSSTAHSTRNTLKNETHALENDILLASLFLGGADWVNHRRAFLNRGDMHLCPDIHACHVLIHFKCLVILSQVGVAFG